MEERPIQLVVDGGIISVDDLVEKVGGDYDFVGVVRTIFPKLSGQYRLVVEDIRGVLHVFSGKNLRKIT